MVKIKVCGITNPEDAIMAVASGADALGFIFAKSPRQVAPENVREIINRLPSFIKTVGVFVDEDLSAIKGIIDFCGLDLIQLHGNESPEFCRELMPRTVKAFRLKDESSLKEIGDYHGVIRAILLDTYRKGLKGGTGETFDWDLALRAGEFGMQIILSGGLGPANIREAISKVRPYAVDVNSGIEERPGKKSAILMKKLFDEIKRGDSAHD